MCSLSSGTLHAFPPGAPCSCSVDRHLPFPDGTFACQGARQKMIRARLHDFDGCRARPRPPRTSLVQLADYNRGRAAVWAHRCALHNSKRMLRSCCNRGGAGRGAADKRTALQIRAFHKGCIAYGVARKSCAPGVQAGWCASSLLAVPLQHCTSCLQRFSAQGS